NTLYAGGMGGVFKSTDGGETWAPPGPGLSGQLGVVQTLVIDPNDARVLYAGTNSKGVFKSIDGGATWQAVNLGLTNLNALVLTMSPDNPSLLYAGTQGGGLFVSLNAGATRSPRNEGWPA